MQTVTVTQMRSLDRMAIKKYGIPSIILMENAGRRVAEETVKLLYGKHILTKLESLYPQKVQFKKNRIIVLCGSGNNGGDGFVAARYLYNYGLNPTVISVKPESELKGDPLLNFTIIKRLGVTFKTINQSFTPISPPILGGRDEEGVIKNFGLIELRTMLAKTDLVVDAMLGTGIKGTVTGIYADIINLVNTAGIKVVAVDIPSGLDGDTSRPLGVCIKATVTVTLGFAKPGLTRPVSRQYVGKLVIVDIGLPRTIC